MVNYFAKRYREDWILERLVGTVLDVGCVGMDWDIDWRKSGHSPLFQRMSDVAPTSGIDLNPVAISRMSNMGFTVFCADAETVTPEDVGGKYDTVVMGDVLEHLSNPQRTLKNLLTIGDRLIVTTPNRLYGWSWVAYGLMNKAEIDPYHYFWSSKATLGNLLRSAGWRVETMECILPDPGSRGLIGMLKYLPEFLIPNIRPTLGAVAVPSGKVREEGGAR